LRYNSGINNKHLKQRATEAQTYNQFLLKTNPAKGIAASAAHCE
jgi:hypothetical protein